MRIQGTGLRLVPFALAAPFQKGGSFLWPPHLRPTLRPEPSEQGRKYPLVQRPGAENDFVVAVRQPQQSGRSLSEAGADLDTRAEPDGIHFGVVGGIERAGDAAVIHRCGQGFLSVGPQFARFGLPDEAFA